MTLRFSASATLLCPERMAEDFAPLLARAGFAAVEFQRLGPGDAVRHAPALAAAGLEVALINLDVGDLAQGGVGLSGTPGRGREFTEALERGYADALALRPRLVHIGPSRVPADVSRDACLRQFKDNLQRARDRLAPVGITVSIEPLNSVDFPDLLVRSPEDALSLMAEVGTDGVCLQYDLYHAAVDGRDIGRDLQTFFGHIGHIQFADHPGRHEPGTGTLPLESFFRLLEHSGYAGFTGAEYLPSQPVTCTFGWLSRWQREHPLQ